MCFFRLKKITNKFIVYLQVYKCNITIMNIRTTQKGLNKPKGISVGIPTRGIKKARLTKFSPSWVVVNSKDAPGYKMELIDRIREGVRKVDWKELIQFTGSTEKEFENILPGSISSMQKKTVYDKETSERIYEVARLFGLGYEVFDTKDEFKQWLMTPSRTLGNKVPFDLLDSSFGFEIVENEIVRIQHNVYS